MEKSSGKRHRRRSHGQVEERVTSKQGHISHSLNSLNYSDSYFFTLSSSSSSSSRKRRKRSFFLFYVAILRFVWILERKNVRLRRHSCVRSMAAKPVHPSRASQLKNTCIICLCVYVWIKSCNLCFFDLINVFYLKFMSMRRESGKLTLRDLASRMSRLKVVGENLTEEDRAACIQDLYQNLDEEVDFEFFLKVCLFISISTSFMRIRAEIREWDRDKMIFFVAGIFETACACKRKNRKCCKELFSIP